MKITLLFENKSASPALVSGHGLSLHIESGGKSILFDVGPDARYAANAEKLGVDIAAVDLLVLSHGHYDHGGGLAHFLQHNSRAPVLLRQGAFGDFYSLGPQGGKYVGLEPSLAQNPRLVFTGQRYPIDENALLFSLQPEDERPFPSAANRALMEQRDGQLLPDAFAHEQNLLLRENGKTFLFCGCCHAGVVGTLRAARRHASGPVTQLFGGFHLGNPATGENEAEPLVRAIGKELAGSHTQYHTFHCTNDAAFAALQGVLGTQLGRLAAGAQLLL